MFAISSVLANLTETAQTEDEEADQDDTSSRASGRKRARHTAAGQQHGQQGERRQGRRELIDLTKVRLGNREAWGR